MRTKRLQRQLKKVFGDEVAESQLAPEHFPQFLDSVEEAYKQLEERVTLAQRSMELSAAELTESNARLFRINQTFDAMLNSLGQGFLLFGPDGICLDICSKACEELIEQNPAGKDVAEVLRVPAHKREAFKGWAAILFQDQLDFAEFSKLGPNHFAHSQGKKISIEFRPVRGSSGQIDFIMLIATDFTREYEASEAAKEMRAHVILVTSILRDKDRFLEFVGHSRRLIRECVALLGGTDLERAFLEVKRHVHTLKGSAGSFGMLPMQTKLHELESEIAKRETAAASVEFLRSEIPKLGALFERALEDNAHITGDLSGTEEPQRRVPLSKLAELARLLEAGQGGAEAKALAEELIAVPGMEVFGRYENLARDTAVKLGKKLRRITVKDAGVRLVPENYGDFFPSLDHIFRNIVDHGIESPEERVAAGKSREGTIAVTINRVGNELEIRIGDDGRGINVESVRKKLHGMGRADLAGADNGAVLNAIFLPGLSTVDKVTQTSGRGVGLDVVRDAVSQCGGAIHVESMPGRGTTFVIRLPMLWTSAGNKGRAA